MEPPPEQCTVNGSLGFVLRVSRIYGLAPLKFEKVADGWRISLSRAVTLYSKTILLLICCFAITSLVMDFCLGAEVSFHRRSSSEIILSVILSSSISAVLLVQAHTETFTTQNMINCLAQIQKINEELCHYGPKTSFEKWQRIMAAWTLICGHFLVILDFCLFFYRVVLKKASYIVEGMSVAFYVEEILARVLILQFALIHTTMLSSFDHLNACLDKLLQQIHKEASIPRNLIIKPKNKLSTLLQSDITCLTLNNVIDTLACSTDTMNGHPDTAPETVHRLGYLYCGLRDVVQRMAKCNGAVLVVIVTYLIVQLINTPYKLINSIFSVNIPVVKVLMTFSWTMHHVLDMIMIVEPCHRTYNQVDNTKHLISQLMRYTPPTNYELITELELFYKHLMMNEVRYSPMRMFKLNRAIIATVLGSILTYLIVFIQL